MKKAAKTYDIIIKKRFYLLESIKALLSDLSKERVIENFYFIGGTALSYYLNHRISYDVDFISNRKLPYNDLMALSVKYNGKYIPDSNETIFKINTGNDLREYKMLFNIKSIKVEFFYPNDPVRLAILEKYKDDFTLINGIKTLNINAIAEFKLLALFRRKKIRDLFDIFVLIKENYLDIDTIDRYCAMEYNKTFIEYIEEFKDDKSESLDFNKQNRYNYFLDIEEKEQFLKENIIKLYINKVKDEKNKTR